MLQRGRPHNSDDGLVEVYAELQVLQRFWPRNSRDGLGHTTPTIGWSKLLPFNILPNESCCREDGHDIVSTRASTSVSNTSRLSPLGHATDSREATDEDPTCRDYKYVHSSSIVASCSRTSIGSSHVKLSARTAGTRLERRTFELRESGGACDLRGDHKLRGVPSLTRT